MYYPTVTIEDSTGNTYTETTVINVLSKDEMDTLLKGKWAGMKEMLTDGDIENALGYFVSSSQDMYRYNFELMSSMLSTIIQDMGDITLDKIEDNVAEYEMIATQDGQTSSFYVAFVRDEDGIWRIRFY